MNIKNWLRRIAIYVAVALLTTYGLLVLGLFATERTVFAGAVEMVGQRGESRKPHSIVLLDRGVDSLHARVKLIREAEKSIELEFFIFDLDESSQLITRELIKRAEDGVDVRILVDFSLAVFKLKPSYAKYLQSRGVKVRYYNTAPIYRFISSQHRSHRKLLIADDERMITGGRNIANDYFDLGHHYNFIDSDILVVGEIVKVARLGFDSYYNSKMAEEPDVSDISAEDFAETASFFADRPGLNELVAKIERLADSGLREFPCDNITFVTDPPARGESHRRVFKELVELSSQAEKNIHIESPYFVLRPDGFDVLKNLTAKGVKLTALTNSLHATDAPYAIASLLFRLGKLKDIGLDLWVMTGERPAEASEMSNVERWGLHAKRAVIDG